MEEGAVSEEPSIRIDRTVWGTLFLWWVVGQNTNEFWTFQIDSAEGVMRTNITQEPRMRMNGGIVGRDGAVGMNEEPSFVVTSGRSQVAKDWRGRSQGNDRERRCYPEFAVVWVYSVP